MANNRVLLCLAHMSGQEMKYIQEAFDTNWVVPLGPNVNAFEEDLERLCGNDKRVVVLSSGTAAIHLALVKLGVGRDDDFFCGGSLWLSSSFISRFQPFQKSLGGQKGKRLVFASDFCSRVRFDSALSENFSPA